MVDDKSASEEVWHRWSLALGLLDEAKVSQLSERENSAHQLLNKLYGGGSKGSLGKISSRWFNEIRISFPVQVVHLLQKDAIDRFGIKKLLHQPTLIEKVEPDVSMVASILSVKDALSDTALANARRLVERLAAKLEEKLKFRMLDLLSGIKDPRNKIRNPRKADIDWDLTIKQNLKHYQHELQTIIPHTLIGRPRRQNASKRVIILVDQSASMTHSFIHAALLASIMTRIRSLSTHLLVFDTRVLDLSEYLENAVELLFKSDLGGGTDIQQAIGYAQSLIEDDRETFMILISDLFEGASEQLMLDRVKNLLGRNITLISLLALDKQGVPVYNRDLAGQLRQWNIPVFACSPDIFPEMMAAALNHEDLARFALTAN